jgi:type VI secretion system protein ImpC
MAQQKALELTTEVVSSGEFQDLLRKELKPRTDRAKSEIDRAVQTLAEQVLSETTLISDDAVDTIKSIIAEIDKKLTDQINEILHNEKFQEVESAWRGLNYLVKNTETDQQLKIKIFNISKNELHKTLRKYRGVAWDQSPLYKTLCEGEYEMFGGEPFGCFIGDYYFDNSPPDVELLGEMSHVAAAGHAPFIAAAAPSVLQLDSWSELSNPRDLAKIFSTPDYASWNSLRDSEDARYVGLTMPRFLARLPYGQKTDPIEEFQFEEETAGANSKKYVWANAAYAMGVGINRAFKLYGWCSQIRGIESGGVVEGLPVHTFPSDDGGVDMKCPTEIAISDPRGRELDNCGFISLTHKKNTDIAAFIGAQSLQRPKEYYDSDATENAKLSARLPYLFGACRFAHYLKSIVRDKVGSFKERAAMQRFLDNWIRNYVDGDPANSSDRVKAERPLAGAEVEVSDVPGDPGFYTAIFRLRPHFQLEGLKASLRLVSKLPSEKKG